MSPLTEPASIVLRPAPEAPSVARRFARHATDGLVDGDRLDNLELLVSELVTNAVMHAGTECLMVLCRQGTLIRVEVHDRTDELPARRAEPDETGGWGLRLLQTLCDDWGAEVMPQGKRVWFTI